MSGETHYRSFVPDLQVRSGGDGRTIYGIAVPYNKAVRINEDLVEQFARGAFNHQLNMPRQVKFAREHLPLGGKLIGAASYLRDDAAGLYVELRASKTPDGDEALELVRDGALDELSVGFMERQNRRLPGGVTERVKANLGEIALVVEGAFGKLATAMGVRSREDYTPVNVSLRAQAEEYLLGLPQLTDCDMEIRALRLGLKLPTT